MSKFREELNRWQIEVDYEVRNFVWCIVLKNGDKNAREHYTNVLREHPDWEEKLMLELYKEGNPDLKYDIEERASISECSIEDAIRMLMKN